MTTTDYLQREIRRVELSIRQAERKPNTPPEELRGLHEKLVHLQEALEAVNEHWQRVHSERGWTAGEPLTREQLIDMEGKPVLLKSPSWTEWCIVRDHGEHEIAGDAISFTRRHYGEVCLGLSDYGKTWAAYACPPARIDREKWEPCAACKSCGNCACERDYDPYEGFLGECASCDLKTHSNFSPENFCHRCGRPLTEEAWAELERRFCGG